MMAVHSTLRSANINEHLTQYTTVYARHRPLLQRFLTVGFVFYVLGTTYRGLSVRSSSGLVGAPKNGKGKADGNHQSGKPPRVAVSITSLPWFLYLPGLMYQCLY
jgi:ATP-binding cassette subfamily D (ALD) long-chain fatty acid import protein